MKLNASEIQKINQAVTEAEKQTQGEIVVYIVKRCTDSSQAYTKALILGLLCGLIAHSSSAFTTFLKIPLGYEFVFIILFCLLLASLLALLPPLHRLFLGPKTIDQATHKRALEAFLSEEVFKTSQRTGILIFVSLFEQKVWVLGDSGINAKVTPSDWHDLVQTVLSGVKNKNLAISLSQAVLDCGELLKKSGLSILPEDKNELCNSLRYAEN